MDNALLDLIINEIKCNGLMSLKDYINLCLYNPQYGFYQTNHYPNHFVTSPTYSILFSKCIANQLSEMFTYLTINNICEIGAGDGKLIVNLLNLLGDKITNYYIVELSEYCKQQQKEALLECRFVDKVVWLDCVPSDFTGVVLANEFLDAQAFDAFVVKDDSVEKLYIDYIDRLHYQHLPGSNHYIENMIDKYELSPELVVPYSDENCKFMQLLSSKMKQGFLLFIDYGYAEGEYFARQQTIRGYYNNMLVDDILQHPGCIDITTNVNFSLLSSHRADLDIAGFSTQASFLINNNITTFFQQLESEDKLNNILQLQYLTSPNYMGEIFKVICFAKGINCNLIGFEQFSLLRMI